VATPSNAGTTLPEDLKSRTVINDAMADSDKWVVRLAIGAVVGVPIAYLLWKKATQPASQRAYPVWSSMPVGPPPEFTPI
jgi:hypothetical protein